MVPLNDPMRLRVIILLVFASSLASQARTYRFYHIGNSLTWDSRPTTLASTVRAAGHIVRQGYHIRCNKSLTYIEANPEDTCVVPPPEFGEWLDALSAHEWDAVTLQAFPGATGAEEVAASRRIIETATAGGRNANCVFYLYLAWPGIQAGSGFSEVVDTPYTSGDEDVFLSPAFLEFWYSELTRQLPQHDVRIVPTGLALKTIDQKLSEVAVGDYTSTFDLYRDAVHLNVTEGRHVALTTMLCSITGVRPEELRFPSTYIGQIDSQFSEFAHDVIWHTVTSDHRTGVASDPEIRLRLRLDGGWGMPEISFVGQLEASTDLASWLAVEGASSPFRISSEARPIYYRAVQR